MGIVLLVAVRRMFLAVALISIATLIARHVCQAIGWNIEGYPQFFFEGPWLLFAAGILVYQRLNYLKGTQAILANCVLAAGILYGLFEYKIGKSIIGNSIDAAGKDRGYYVQHFGEYLIVAHAFALALVVCRRWDEAIVRSSVARPLLFCGKLSYSIYLTHYLPVIAIASVLNSKEGVHDDGRVVLITLPISLLVMLPIAWAFHILIERRFLNAPQDEGDAGVRLAQAGSPHHNSTARPQSPS